MRSSWFPPTPSMEWPRSRNRRGGRPDLPGQGQAPAAAPARPGGLARSSPPAWRRIHRCSDHIGGAVVARPVDAGLRLFGPRRRGRRGWPDGMRWPCAFPGNDFLLALMERTGVLVVTSANRHGEPTPTSAHEAGSHLPPHVKLVIDAGTLDSVALDAGQRPLAGRQDRARRGNPPRCHRSAAATFGVSRYLLAIETSCDETAAAVISDDLRGAVVRGGEPNRSPRRVRRGRS